MKITEDSRTSPPSEFRRVLTFEGGCNFRDVGGYRTRAGQELAWGKVYRTGVLSYFTEGDHAGLRKLGVSAICDLRREPERGREPTRWPDAGTELLSWDDGAAPPTVQTLAAARPYTAAGMRAAMLDLYRALPLWMAPRLRGMFERIAAGAGPVLVHCAAGKDRTGIAIAMLLALLDVPHETIVEDYLLTNEAGDFQKFILSREKAELGVATAHHPLLAMPEDIKHALFAADAEYLDAALDQIARDCGDTQTFLREKIGIDAQMQRTIRNNLLRG